MSELTEDAMHEERCRLVKERDALLKAHGARRPGLARAYEKAREVTAAAESALRAAEAKAEHAYLELSSADLAAENGVERRNRQLRDSASPVIAAFIAHLGKRRDEVSRMPPVDYVEVPLDFGDAPVPVADNYRALGRWMNCAVEVMRRAAGLRFEALDDDQLGQRLAALEQELGELPGLDAVEAWDPALDGVVKRGVEEINQARGLGVA